MVLQRLFPVQFLFLFVSVNASGGSYFEEQTAKLPTNGREHSFCKMYEGENQIQGENISGLVKIASVSKLATSYWALKTYGADYRFITKIYYNTQSRSLHISGSRDPVFGRNRMYLLLSELNRLGIEEVDRVSFDSQFKLYTEVETQIRSKLGVEGGVSQATTKNSLEIFFNTSRWDTSARYEKARKLGRERGIEMLPSVSFSAPLVESAEAIPFSVDGPVIAWEYASIPLYQILKLTNVESYNYIADEIFNGLGGARAFAAFARRELGMDDRHIRMYTGSGLPLEQSGKRLDNEASCEAILDVMQRMSEYLRDEAGMNLPDVMLVTGEDRGTLKRYKDEIFDASMVAKTGTINYAVTMAGQIYTEDGRIFYGIYLQVPKSSLWGRARKIRDQIITNLIDVHGGPRSIDYNKGPDFFPVDIGSRLREFNGRHLGKG